MAGATVCRTTRRSLLFHKLSLVARTCESRMKGAAMTHAGHSSLRRGFTLLELLVAIAIIGILLSLLLVGIQYSREAMRRTVCQNNLRQIGIALSQYASRIRSYPPVVIWTRRGEPLGRGIVPIGVVDRFTVGIDTPADPDPIHANWVIMLLPFLEEGNLLEQFDVRLPVSHEKNAKARTQNLPVFRCPSDSFNRSDNLFLRGLQVGRTSNSYARGNYGINVGPDDDCVRPGDEEHPCPNGFFAPKDLLTENEQVWGSGLAGVNKSFGPHQVIDGLSQTVIVDELRAGVHALDPRGVWALGQVGSSATARHGRFGDAGRPNHTNSRGEEFMGCTALREAVGSGYLASQGMPCYQPFVREIEINAQAGARSMHPGGVNALMCDGSVHFIADEIDVEAWHALHTRDSQDLVEGVF